MLYLIVPDLKLSISPDIQDFLSAKQPICDNCYQITVSYGGSFIWQDEERTFVSVKMVVGRVDISRATSLIEQQFGDMYTEFPIVKDTTPNMMNPRLYTTSYNKPRGQQFDDTAVLSFIKLQYT